MDIIVFDHAIIDQPTTYKSTDATVNTGRFTIFKKYIEDTATNTGFIMTKIIR